MSFLLFTGIILREGYPTVQSTIEPPTPIVITATSRPVTLPLSTATSVQIFESGGQCASTPVNLEDNLEVQLDPSRWYLIEEFDNRASPPKHIFRAQIGTISVNANADSGLRAWECRSESAAIAQAQLNAMGYKQNNPSHIVIGPDGQEVK